MTLISVIYSCSITVYLIYRHWSIREKQCFISFYGNENEYTNIVSSYRVTGSEGVTDIKERFSLFGICLLHRPS